MECLRRIAGRSGLRSLMLRRGGFVNKADEGLFETVKDTRTTFNDDLI